MKQIVIFAEKPSQAKAYADAFTVASKHKTHIVLAACPTFPNGATITWGIGHLVELKDPKAYDTKWTRWNLASLPIFPETFEFQVAKGKFQQFKAVQQLFRQADLIINACDIDREGSNIFYSILNQTGVQHKKIRRLWINSLEVDEVRKGFQQTHTNEKDLLLYAEAYTRQVSDWLVGMNASRLYTILLKAKGYEQVFPIGRVQSPTVYLVYERARAIENFVSEPFFEVEGDFNCHQGTYRGKAKVKTATKEEIIQVLRKHQMRTKMEGTIQQVKKSIKKVLPPPLHSLSTLQTTANRKWKWSPSQTLKLAQALYEKKLITYPRTDSRHITPNEYSYLKDKVSGFQQLSELTFPIQEPQPLKRYVDATKVQEHYAIIPTKTVPTAARIQKLPADERTLYLEIVRSTLAIFHLPHLYEETVITTNVSDLLFYTTGNTVKQIGWKACFPTKEKEKELLPVVEEGEVVQAAIRIHEGKTTPPKPYTEGQLITLMKTCGQLIEDEAETEILKEIEGIGTEATRSNIIDTIKKHAYIRVQKNIVSLTDKGRILCEAIEGTLLSSPSMTAKWETYLRKIGTGEGQKEQFLKSMEKFIQHLLDTTTEKIERTHFSIQQIEGQAPYAKKKFAKIAKCPRCEKGTIIQHPKFYGCSAYKEGCKQTFPGFFLGKRLTATHIRALCEKGHTEKIEGFRSKDGRVFSAALQFNKGEIQLKFM